VSPSLFNRWSGRAVVVTASLLAALACSSEGDGNTEPVGAIALTLNPTSASVQQGGTVAVAATLTRSGGFTGDVALSVEGAPAGVTATIGNIVTAGGTTTATVTILVGAATPVGTSNITVRGKATGLTDATAAYALTVTATPSYTLSLSSAALSIVQGGSTPTTTVNIARTNFPGAVTLGVGSLPAGVTAAFAPPAPTENSSVLTLSVGAAVTPGVYNLTVNGTATAGGQSTPLTLTVTAAVVPTYTLSLSSAALTIVQGGNTPTTTVNIARTNFPGAVTLSVSGLPGGVTAAFAPPAPTENSSVLTLSVGAAVTPGVYNLTVTGTATVGNPQNTPLQLTVTATPSYGLSLTSAALSIAQGSNTPTTTVNIARTNYTGAITLALNGAPAGVAGAFAGNPVAGNSSVLTITVGAAVVPGVYNLTVTGVAALLTRASAGPALAPEDQSTPLQLTVTVAAGFTISTTPTPTATVAQGANTNVTVNVNRTGGFDDGVTLTATGQPAGLTVGFVPNPATANSSVMTLTAAGGLAAGNYPIVIHGNATVGEQTANLTVTVTAPSGGGNVTVSFAACTAENKAVWLAYQDGNGAWTRVVGSADVYQFNITQGKGGLAYVVLGASSTSQILVLYFSQAEMTGGTLDYCPTLGTERTVNGTVANLGAGLQATISFGGGSVNAFADGPFQLTDVQTGLRDLVAYIRPVTGISGTDKIFFSRGLNPASGGSVGTVDVNAAVTAGAGFMTLVGGTGAETVVQSMAYYTGAACNTAGTLYSANVSAPPTFYAYGAPAGQPSTDYHGLSVTALAGSGLFRSVTEVFHSMAARNITLPSILPVPAISDAGGPYKRPMVVTTLPADLNSSALFSYVDMTVTGKTGVISATAGWLGGLNVSLTLPDFSALPGWNNAWAPGTSDGLQWVFAGTGNNLSSLCQEGGRVATSVRSGLM